MTRVGIVAAAAVCPEGPRLVQRLAQSHPGTLGFEVTDVGELPGSRKQHRLMARAAELAAVATHRCLAAAGWHGGRDAVGLYMGVGEAGGAMEDLEAIARASVRDHALSLERLGQEGLHAANPLGTFHTLNNFTLCHSAIVEALGGPNAAIYSQGAGTLAAIAEAREAIAAGCERVVAGGADSTIHPVVWEKLGACASPSEGAAMFALMRDRGPLGWLGPCAIVPADAGVEQAADALDAALGGAPEAVVLATSDREAHACLLARYARAQRRIIDANARFGFAAAAAPALALKAALDLKARAVDVVVLGPDRQLAGLRIEQSGRAIHRETRRPVITGVGVVSPFGVGTARFFDALADGASAIGPIASFDARAMPVRVAGEATPRATDAAWLCEALPAARFAEPWERHGILRDRKAAFAVVAATEAWANAGCTERDVPLCLALGLAQSWPEDYALLFDGARFDFRRTHLLPRERIRGALDLAARCVQQQLGISGPCVVNSSACAAGAMSLAQGAAMIARGQASLVLCGAADSMVNPLALGGFWALGAPSPRASADACRPFDATRDGLVIGEGAALFVLEDEARARARGATIHARVLGWASTQDGYRATMPRPDGAAAARAMRAAIDAAGVQPGYVNAHGTGTPLNDPAECSAIRSVAGNAAVSSIKGAVGHLMAASGAIEAAACVMALTRGVLPGTAHLGQIDPECADLDILGPAPRRQAVEAILTNSFGFGGQNCCLVLGRA